MRTWAGVAPRARAIGWIASLPATPPVSRPVAVSAKKGTNAIPCSPHVRTRSSLTAEVQAVAVLHADHRRDLPGLRDQMCPDSRTGHLSLFGRTGYS